MACQSKDVEALKLLQMELLPILNSEQNELFQLVIECISQRHT